MDFIAGRKTCFALLESRLFSRPNFGSCELLLLLLLVVLNYCWMPLACDTNSWHFSVNLAHLDLHAHAHAYVRVHEM